MPVTPGGPTFPLAPIILAPVPRTGPLGDGSPLTPQDTLLTLNWLDKATSDLNLTEGEREVYQALTLDLDDLVQVITSIREGIENDDVEIVGSGAPTETEAMDDSGSGDVEILDIGKPAGETIFKFPLLIHQFSQHFLR